MRLKRTLLAALAGLTIQLLSSSALAKEFNEVRRQEINREFSTAPGETRLTVKNIFGSVSVRGHKENVVRITGVRIDRARDAEALERAQEEVELKIEQTGNELRAVVDGPFRDGNKVNWDSSRYPYQVAFELEIWVPIKTSLDVSTVNKGTVNAANIEGNFRLSNVNGPVHAENLQGAGEIRSVNGKVTVEFAANPTSESTFKTVNGNVEVSFPQDLDGEIVARTVNGDLYSDFDLLLRSSRGVGAKRFRLTAGKGGPELNFQTINGDILIRKR